ncbi:MAG: ATP-dependent sacrificial sulfur transferase LarE [Thermoplasmata archaeon]
MIPTSQLDPRHEPVAPSAIEASLADGRRALVALSGGVDSSVVALLAHQALGPNAVAVTLTGPAVSPEELDSARNVARAIGIRHVLLTSDPLSDSRYAENPTNRCYFCRNHEGDLLRAWGQAHGIEVYLDGVHLDDLGDDRPGLQAMNEHGFRHPLAEAGWTKADIRAFARSAGLPTWDRPSNACLASRITHGEDITAPLLDQVARAEEWVSARGYRRVRVRVSGGRARVEVDPDEVPELQAEVIPLREALTALGFASVEIDPNGYRPRSNI